MIRMCTEGDFNTIYSVINDAAQAYRGIIPGDRWKQPYMSEDELRHEMASDVVFWGYEDGGELIGVGGIQQVRDVTLIRHAYVRSTRRNQGIGSRILTHLMGLTAGPVLVGTWSDAVWAVQFYERHGFRRLSDHEKDRVLRTYWSIPERQIQTSVVLGDRRWFGSCE